MDTVPLSRWQQAQEYELRTWKRRLTFPHYHALLILHYLGLRSDHPQDDWNQWWRRQFDHYSMLPAHLHGAIEVGCGPFTNLRLIRTTCRIERIVLNDPLINHYAGMRRSWINHAMSMEGVTLDARPLEDLHTVEERFDLAVMINVLDHVYDLGRCMSNATRLVKNGGYIIVGQDLYDPLPGNEVEDVGHPVRVKRDQVAEMLERRFEVVYNRVLDRASGRNPKVHGGTLLFVGQRRSSRS